MKILHNFVALSEYMNFNFPFYFFQKNLFPADYRLLEPMCTVAVTLPTSLLLVKVAASVPPPHSWAKCQKPAKN